MPIPKTTPIIIGPLDTPSVAVTGTEGLMLSDDMMVFKSIERNQLTESS